MHCAQRHSKGQQPATRSSVCNAPLGHSPCDSMLQRVNLKDYITVYSEGEPDSSAVRIRTNTRDLADLAWSPDSKMIAAWDSPLAYRVSVYQPDGSLIGTFEAYEGALGVRSVQWSPDSQLLAVGSYDQVRSVKAFGTASV